MDIITSRSFPTRSFPSITSRKCKLRRQLCYRTATVLPPYNNYYYGRVTNPSFTPSHLDTLDLFLAVTVNAFIFSIPSFIMTLSLATKKLLLQKQPLGMNSRLITKQLQQMLQQRFHHPDPFNPKMTRGWKAALAVRVCLYVYICVCVCCNVDVDTRRSSYHFIGCISLSLILTHFFQFLLYLLKGIEIAS